MKVLIITYYFPPAGGAGVQRWLKFVKYLPEFGIKPIVYTVKNGNYPIKDTSLCDEIPKEIQVLKTSIWEPSQFLNFNKKNPLGAGFLSSKKIFFNRIISYIRANCYIPDTKKNWIKPSVKYLLKYLQENEIEILISTGPPHTTHLIAKQLKEKYTAVKWLADFRDPWTKIDYFHNLPLTKRTLQRHSILEKEVLSKADATSVVGKTMAKDYQKINSNTFILPNGFDFEIPKKYEKLDKNFTITYIGSMNYDRNPKILWESLKYLCEKNKTFAKHLKVQLIGKIDKQIIRQIKQEYHLEKYVKQIAYLPHNKVLNYQMKSQILLLCVNNVPSNKGIITGKVYEYLAVKRPIIAIAPKDGDLADILRKTKGGVVVDYQEIELLKKQLKQWYKDYLNNNLKVTPKNIEVYHRKNLTRKLVGILKNL